MDKMQSDNEEDNSKNEPPPTIGELWSEFGSTCSTHGFPFIFSARGKITFYFG